MIACNVVLMDKNAFFESAFTMFKVLTKSHFLESLFTGFISGLPVDSSPDLTLCHWFCRETMVSEFAGNLVVNGFIAHA